MCFLINSILYDTKKLLVLIDFFSFLKFHRFTSFFLKILDFLAILVEISKIPGLFA